MNTAEKLLTEAGEDPLCYLDRHASGDWGELDNHDRRENERSLRHGWRILSSYPVGEKIIWVITEADRSVTTILLSEEYYMPCAFCGEGDEWIKTCRIKDGSHLRVCDPCWEVLSPWLVIVPGMGWSRPAAMSVACTSILGKWRRSVPVAVKTPTQGRAMSVRRKAPGMPPGRLSKGLPDKPTKERSSGEENSRLYPLCRGYWSEGGKCRIRVYREDGHDPVVMCSQLPANENTSATNMAEYLAAEVIGEYSLPVPLLWIEHYPEHEGGIGEYSQVRFSSWDHEGVCPGACDATLPAHPACL